MKLTTKQLKQIIREEITRLTESGSDLQKLISNDDPQVVMQGFELATIMDEPIVFRYKPNYNVLELIEEIKPQDIISLLISDQQHLSVVNSLARNLNITEENMQKIASYREGDGYYASGIGYVHVNLAENPNVTAKILDILSDSDSPRAVRLVAKNPKTLPESLERIFKNWGLQDPPRNAASTIIPQIIYNKNTTNELLLKIASMPYGYYTMLATEELQERGVEIPYQQDQFSDEDSEPDDLYDSEWDYDSEDDDDEF